MNTRTLVLALFIFNQNLAFSNPVLLDTVSVNPQNKDNIIIGKIFKLKEVKKRQAYLTKNSKKFKGHLAIILDTMPTKKQPYYLLRVGYDGSLRFENYYHFRINEKYILQKDITKYLEILDIESGDYLPLIKWRKTRLMLPQGSAPE